MNVLSLFDGISCGQVALKRLMLPIDNYYASEVDKYAVKVTQANHPNTIQLGDVTEWRSWDIDWSSIDLLMGGSPCQGFSFAGKQLAFDDPRSKLFFVYVDILNHIRNHNPDIKFLLENVRMKKEFLDVISDQLGVEPVFINSALVSAQNRQRYYWANWSFGEPEDMGILLKDIVHENERFDKVSKLMGYNIDTFNVNPPGRGMNGDVINVNQTKSRTLTTNKGEGQKISVALSEYIVPFDKTLQILDKEVERGKVGYFRKRQSS